MWCVNLLLDLEEAFRMLNELGDEGCDFWYVCIFWYLMYSLASFPTETIPKHSVAAAYSTVWIELV